MLTCKDAARAIGQDELRTGVWRRRLSLQLHLLMCRHCRRYTAQVRTLGETARRVFLRRGDDPRAVERIRARVLGGAKSRPGSPAPLERK